MGEEVSISKGARLHVRMPTLARGAPAELPKLKRRARLLRAIKDGWEEIAVSEGDLAITPDQPGAYRAEIRVKPGHLAKHMSYMASETERELVWVYSNVIYVVK